MAGRGLLLVLAAGAKKLELFVFFDGGESLISIVLSPSSTTSITCFVLATFVGVDSGGVFRLKKRDIDGLT